MAQNKILKLDLPTYADITFFIVFGILAFLKGDFLLRDLDTGYLIRMGDEMIRTRAWIPHDIFSHVSPPIPWQNHEWLSQILMALAHKAGGLTGIVLFFSLLIALIYTALFKELQARSGSLLAAFFVTVLVIFASEINWYARPHIFTLLFILLWIFWLQDWQYQDKKRWLLFPCSMILWVNLHGGFILGLMLISIYFAGNSVYFLSHSEKRSIYHSKISSLTLLLMVCTLAALLNPHGFHALLYPFQLIANKIVMSNILEFKPPDFQSSTTIPFRVLLIIFAVFLILAKGRLTLFEVLVTLFFLKMALKSVRHMSLFALGTAPILLSLIQRASLSFQSSTRWVGFQKHLQGMSAFHASLKGGVWPVGLILLASFLAVNGKLHYQFDSRKTPEAAVAFIQREKLSGNMFNLDEFGDYILYRTWPQYKVFVYGFHDPSGAERLRDFLKIDALEPGWEQRMEKYGIQWVFYPVGRPLIETLLKDPDWQLIYQDPIASILIKKK